MGSNAQQHQLRLPPDRPSVKDVDVPRRKRGRPPIALTEEVLEWKRLSMKRVNASRPKVRPLNFTFQSPRDDDGHGTHTLSTAAGYMVPGANVLGYANGTTKGGSPKARVVAYKVCWQYKDDGQCFDTDILAAFEHDILDGVDVLSASIGGDTGDPFFQGGTAIGSFHDVKHGIPVVFSAGN